MVPVLWQAQKMVPAGVWPHALAVALPSHASWEDTSLRCACLAAELLGLEVWNQGMTLGLRDAKTGTRRWESQFVMPVISAFLPSGAEVPLSQAAAPALALPGVSEGLPAPLHLSIIYYSCT